MLALLGAILPTILSGLTSFVQWLLTTKAGLITLAVIVGVSAFGAYTFYIKHEAASEEEAKVAAQMQKETAAEHTRRDQALQAAQKQAATTLARLATTESRNQALQAKIRQLASTSPSRPCLDPNSYQNLLGAYK
jgi:uncharacterized protein HemX